MSVDLSRSGELVRVLERLLAATDVDALFGGFVIFDLAVEHRQDTAEGSSARRVLAVGPVAWPSLAEEFCDVPYWQQLGTETPRVV